MQGEINENAGEAAGLRASSNNGAAGDEYGVTNELPAGMTCPPPAPTGPSSFILHPFNNPSAYFPSFLGGVVWSYVFAACFLGIAIVAARLWGPAVDQQQIVQATALAPLRTGTAPDPLTAHDLQDAVFPVAETAAGGSPMIVGKITGTFNCQWADPCVAARVGEPVPRGRKYPITSGLLEITYNTGAKVIIEGPANYSASARNAASLYFGKLTADVGKLDRAKLISGEQALGRPLPSSHVPAFRVHTPSGVVTDDGDQAARFGVEVARPKTTFLRVSQGLVTFATAGFDRMYAVPAGICVWTGAAQNTTAF